MKVFTTVCSMVALASAESQLLVAQNNVNYLRSPNVGKMRYNGYVDYVDTSRTISQPALVNNYQIQPTPQQITVGPPQVNLQPPNQEVRTTQYPTLGVQPQITLGPASQGTQYATTLGGQPLVPLGPAQQVTLGHPQVTVVHPDQTTLTSQTFQTYDFHPMVTMRFKREAEAEATHAKAYKSKVSNPDGSSYEYEVQVDHDGEGKSFQRHEQKTDEQRIEEQLYHNMMNARNLEEIQRFNEIMKNSFGTEKNRFDRNRFGAEQNQRTQQYGRDFGSNQNRQNQLLNQLINNQIQRQPTASFNRFFQLQQQRPQYSHRLINSKNNQQRQQYIREKLNSFGMKKSEDVLTGHQSNGHRMFKRSTAEPVPMLTYRIATQPIVSVGTLRNNVYSRVEDNIDNLNNFRGVVYQVRREQPMAFRQANLNAESMKEIHPEGTVSLRKIYNNDIYQLGRNYGYETMVDLAASNSH